MARIGRYDVRTAAWTWSGYPLDTGSGIGLSELVALDRNTFAVIERDNLPLTKTLARDLLPDLQAGNGWVQQKVEGLAVGGNRQV